MSGAAVDAWRVFPWDRAAEDGEPYSSSWVPSRQGQGRFDLPATPGGVLYLAESPEHAVAEMIQHYRGQALDESDLRVAGRPLAIVAVSIPARTADKLADLCDPSVLTRLGLRADETASMNRRVTQGIAARVRAEGYSGLRWWSALSGDWHTIVLFRARPSQAPSFGVPGPLSLEHPAVRDAMPALGMSRARGR